MLRERSDEHTGLTQASGTGRSLCKLCIPNPRLTLDKTNPKPTRHNESAPQRQCGPKPPAVQTNDEGCGRINSNRHTQAEADRRNTTVFI